MSMEISHRETTDLAAIPEKLRAGGKDYMVPTSLDAMYQLLEQTKNMPMPLPIRASLLPADCRAALYAIGGIPDHVAPHHVGMFAGQPYVFADGAIDAAVEIGCHVWTEPDLRVIGCATDEGLAAGCPGGSETRQRDGSKTWVEAKPGDKLFRATAHARKPSGGRVTEYGIACPHTFRGQAQHRPQMARTRAERKASMRVMGMRAEIVMSEPDHEPDFIEGETVEVVTTHALPGISDGQRKLLWKTVRDAKMPEDDFRALLADKYGIESTNDLTSNQASELIDLVATYKPPATETWDVTEHGPLGPEV